MSCEEDTALAICSLCRTGCGGDKIIILDYLSVCMVIRLTVCELRTLNSAKLTCGIIGRRLLTGCDGVNILLASRLLPFVEADFYVILLTSGKNEHRHKKNE